MSLTSYKLETELNNTWTLWAHLPHDTDWSLDSYKPISNINSIHDALSITEVLSSTLVENCMLFIMLKGITPIWEDKNNRNGGCFSYKILNKNVHECWTELSYRLYGNTLSNESNFNKSVNGITISPKKNFCIIKIWMSNCDYNDSKLLTSNALNKYSTDPIFKKHAPEW